MKRDVLTNAEVAMATQIMDLIKWFLRSTYMVEDLVTRDAVVAAAYVRRNRDRKARKGVSD